MSLSLLGPDPANGGVGTYTEKLASKLEDSKPTFFEPGWNPVEYGRATVRASCDHERAIHIQYTYELFGPLGCYTFVLLPVLWVATRVQRSTLAVTMHEVWDEEDTDGPVRTAYARLMHLWLAAFSDHLVFLSEGARTTFQKQSVLGTGTVIPHGVPTDETVVVEDPRHYFEIPEDTFLITQHGFVNQRKGFDRFLNIAVELPEYEFLIAGRPRGERFHDYYDHLQAQAPENVQFTGVLDEKEFHAAFQASDLAVLPYNSIYQSGIFNWCAAYGVPTIASRIPYFEQLYAEYRAPELFDTVEEACSLVHELQENDSDRRELSENLEGYARKNSFERVVERHYELYESL